MFLEKARTVLRRFLAVSRSRAISSTGLSTIPAVMEPSHRMMVPYAEQEIPSWSQRSSRLPILACMLAMFGVLVASEILKWWFLKSLWISFLFCSVMWNGNGPIRWYLYLFFSFQTIAPLIAQSSPVSVSPSRMLETSTATTGFSSRVGSSGIVFIVEGC